MATITCRTLYKNNNLIFSGRLVPLHNFFGKSGKPSSVGYRFLKTDTSQPKTNLIQRIKKTLFGRYLLTTNIVGSGVLMVIGDVMAQEIEYRRGWTNKRLDLGRTGRMFIVGALQGPLHHFFYKWIDTIMPVVTMRSVFKKIALDQIIMSPMCIMLFFYSAGILERKTIEQCHYELQSKFLTVYTVDWLVWPFAQFINFYWLHPKYRVTYVNLVTMLYNVFLSYIKHEDQEVKQIKNVKNQEKN